MLNLRRIFASGFILTILSIPRPVVSAERPVRIAETSRLESKEATSEEAERRLRLLVEQAGQFYEAVVRRDPKAASALFENQLIHASERDFRTRNGHYYCVFFGCRGDRSIYSYLRGIGPRHLSIDVYGIGDKNFFSLAEVIYSTSLQRNNNDLNPPIITFQWVRSGWKVKAVSYQVVRQPILTSE